jgi:hypothetical protein
MQSGSAATTRLNATRLKILVEADSGSLVRVLQFFQARNVTPLCVAAQRLGAEFLQIDIDITDAELSAEALHVIVAKINELPVSICAVVTQGLHGR